MYDQSRIFDFLYDQLNRFPKTDMLAAKENGQWITYSTQQVADMVTQVSAGLLRLGIGGKQLSVEEQDKVAIISRNRPEWLILDMACQQIGVILCPIYPTTNVNEIEFIFNDAAIQYVFVSGQEIFEKMQSVQPKISTLKSIYSFDPLPGARYWKELIAEDLSEWLPKV